MVSCRASLCYSLRTCTFIIAVAEILIFAFLVMIFTVLFLDGSRPAPQNDPSLTEEQIKMITSANKSQRNLSIPFLVVSLTGLALSGLLLYGTWEKHRKVMSIWFYIYAGFLGLQIVLNVAILILYLFGKVDQIRIGIPGLVFIIVQSYILLVVYGFRKELVAESTAAAEGVVEELSAIPPPPDADNENKV